MRLVFFLTTLSLTLAPLALAFVTPAPTHAGVPRVIERVVTRCFRNKPVQGINETRVRYQLDMVISASCVGRLSDRFYAITLSSASTNGASPTIDITRTSTSYPRKDVVALYPYNRLDCLVSTGAGEPFVTPVLR